MTAIAMWCGYYKYHSHIRRQALARIGQLGGTYWEHGQIPNQATAKPGSKWATLSQRYDDLVCELFGNALRTRIVALDLSGVDISDQDLAQLKPLYELEWLTLKGSSINDRSARHVQRFARLKWLDVSGSAITLDGVRQLSDLRSLQWLNVARTQLGNADIATIQKMFPHAKIGFNSNPEHASPLPVASGPLWPKASNVGSLWSALQANPYSDDSLKTYLDVIGRSSAVDFGEWYVSAVYHAERAEKEPLLVVEVYDGTRRAFNLGCLLVFDPNGVLLREIPKERVHWSLGGPTRLVNWMDQQSAQIRADQQAASRREILDLVDLNGDGFDEISTQRWDGDLGTFDVGGESTSIYTVKSNDIPCVFCIAFPRQPPLGNTIVDLSSRFPTLTYRQAASGELFLVTPCYAVSGTRGTLLDLPQRTLAKFWWSDERGTFEGPTVGPRDTWLVIRRQLEFISSR
jgi:hypothetical protein